jgi:phosphoserine aminotransferase
MTAKPNRVHNFSAGPAALPLSLLERVREELLDFDGSGMSVMEMSHRSARFRAVIERAEAGLRRAMGIPADFDVLFLQGGASLQFGMIPMNLYRNGHPVDVIHTGNWTQRAIDDLERVASWRLAASGEKDAFRKLPRREEMSFEAGASYVHMASNNTIRGTQWREFPDTGGVPLVVDMSSDILSRPVDVKRFGVVFAGAQKNLGPSGVTIVIIRKDLVERAPETLPAMLQYRVHSKNASLYNTPCTFGVYMIARMMDWVEESGGVEGIARRNAARAGKLYRAIDGSGGFYRCDIPAGDRSRMNVVFRIQEGEEGLEGAFVKQAEAGGLIGLKGHRSVGGLRASLYNAQTDAAVDALVGFMASFAAKHG